MPFSVGSPSFFLDLKAMWFVTWSECQESHECFATCSSVWTLSVSWMNTFDLLMSSRVTKRMLGEGDREGGHLLFGFLIGQTLFWKNTYPKTNVGRVTLGPEFGHLHIQRLHENFGFKPALGVALPPFSQLSSFYPIFFIPFSWCTDSAFHHFWAQSGTVFSDDPIPKANPSTL